MNFIYPPLNTKVDFNNNQIFSLIVENSKMFHMLCQDLYNQYNGLSGEALFSDGEDLEMDKQTIFIYDYLDINNNVSKITNMINKTMEAELNRGDYITELNNINQQIINLNKKLLQETDLPIDFNKEFTAERFVKLAGFFALKSEKLCENILTHIELLSKIKKVKLIIFVNPFIYLSENTLTAILHDLEFEDVKILLINNYEKYIFNNIPKLTIDEDLCVF